MKKVATPRGLRDCGHLFSKSPEAGRSLRISARLVSSSSEYATLGLTPFASKSEVKHAYKRLALKYHPDVLKRKISGQEKEEAFKEIKSAYESLMTKFNQEEVAEEATGNNMDGDDEWEEEWNEWMGFEGGMPIVYNPS